MSIRQSVSSVVNYLPGFVILVFGVLALYSSLRLVQEYDHFLKNYELVERQIFFLQGEFEAFGSSFSEYRRDQTAQNYGAVKENFKILNGHYRDMLSNPAPEGGEGVDLFIKNLMGMESDFKDLSKALDRLENSDAMQSFSGISSPVTLLESKFKNLSNSLHDEIGEDYFSKTLKTRENWLFVSILLISLSGFSLIILNADKLRKLTKVNLEKKANLNLLESRLAAMEASADGIGIIDENGKLTYMNHSLMELHGISEGKASQYLGQSWEKLYAEKGKTEIFEKAYEMLKQQNSWRGELAFERRDGESVFAELTLTRLAGGGLVATARNITNQKRADQENKQLQDQFYQAQKMEAIGRLAGGIAHDFNNILAAMSGYAEFLVEDLEGDEDKQKFAVSILKAATQARGLVDQMLAFSRRKQSETDHVDLNLPIEETLSMLKATLPKTIELQKTIDGGSFFVDGNATQISQVIMNLCVNAKDAMKNKGILSIGLKILGAEEAGVEKLLQEALPEPDEVPKTLLEECDSRRTRLFLGGLAQNQKYAVLSVSDTGTGMSRTVMEHIFEPFFTTKPVDKGTGLGLATVHGVVASHRGAMVIDSTVSEGTRFDLFFPLSRESKKDAQSEQGLEESHAGHSASVLLVEDQDDVRDMTTKMLERMGHKVSACTMGLEALDKIRERPGAFDLVITDQNMPKMNGLELITQVGYDFPEVPFILLSGYSQEKMQAMLKEHPSVKAVLRKPITREALQKKIAAILGEMKEAA